MIHLYLLLMILLYGQLALTNDNLRVAFEWKEMDFAYSSDEQRLSAIENMQFKPENVIPFGIEVYQTRLFITLPRWRDGVPASLAYFELNGNLTKSPRLKPYPSWEAHNMKGDETELVSPFRVRADRCGRLWVLDPRIEGNIIHGSAQLLVYDLHNDNLLRRHIYPKSQIKQGSLFANLAIEDDDCNNTFAYAADLGNPGLIVYSWSQHESWRIHHNYFHPDPLSGNYSIGNVDFQWDDGIYGIALSKANANGFATLYFHPLSSTMEFSVSTMILRNKSLALNGSIYHEFKILGSRGPSAQAGASFLDPLTGVLFYSLPNLNAVACWKTSNRAYTIKSQGRVYMSPVEMVFPSDVKVDDQDRLWILSNRLQDFIYGNLSANTINFRILTAHVKDAIENTACDIKSKPLPEIINKLGDILNTVTNPTQKTSMTSSANLVLPVTFLFILTIINIKYII